MKKVETNTELLLLLKEGNMVAFDAIYGRYCRRLYEFVIRYVKTEADAEEIVQEVFIKIWEHRDRIDVYSSFESFVFTISYNSAISLLRKKVHENKYFEYLKSLQNVDQVYELTDEIYFRELTSRMQLLLKELTPRQREIFQLSREEGLTHNEIAKRLGISVNTVKNHMVTVLGFLKSNIDNGSVVNVLFAYLFL
ncbi:MAG: RNA polymerase sigma factor [Mangrovibacterium sp.]